MQTIVTTLSVRVPVGIDTMSYLAQATEIMRQAKENLTLPEPSTVELLQTVESDTPTVATPAPRRRGPNRAKAVNATGIVHVASAESTAPTTVAKDTSKPGSEVTQPAWKVQAETDGKLKSPPFLDRTGGTANAGKAA